MRFCSARPSNSFASGACALCRRLFDWRIIAVYAASYVPVLLLTLVYLGFWGVPEFSASRRSLPSAAISRWVNSVFVASVRYRFPLEPFMIVFAAAALVRLMRRWPAARPALARIGLDHA
jgi:hypothetical protein